MSFASAIAGVRFCKPATALCGCRTVRVGSLLAGALTPVLSEVPGAAGAEAVVFSAFTAGSLSRPGARFGQHSPSPAIGVVLAHSRKNGSFLGRSKQSKPQTALLRGRLHNLYHSPCDPPASQSAHIAFFQEHPSSSGVGQDRSKLVPPSGPSPHAAYAATLHPDIANRKPSIDWLPEKSHTLWIPVGMVDRR